MTYMIEGAMCHKDSTGGEGLLGPGSIQWMTAGHTSFVYTFEGSVDVNQLALLSNGDQVTLSSETGGSHIQPTTAGHTSFVYAFEGSVDVGGTHVGLNQLAIVNDGDEVQLTSNDGGRAIIVAGRPIGEPIARYGPFVTNTETEIRQAITDFQTGSFL